MSTPEGRVTCGALVHKFKGGPPESSKPPHDVPAVTGIALLLLTRTLLPQPLCALNGEVAIALPLEGIKVDGDLSDWPEGDEEIPHRPQSGGGPPEDGRRSHLHRPCHLH